MKIILLVLNVTYCELSYIQNSKRTSLKRGETGGTFRYELSK